MRLVFPPKLNAVSQNLTVSSHLIVALKHFEVIGGELILKGLIEKIGVLNQEETRLRNTHHVVTSGTSMSSLTDVIRQMTRMTLLMTYAFCFLQASGVVRDLSPEFLLNLLRGLVYVQVSSDDTPQGELRSQVLIDRNTCSKRIRDPQQSPRSGYCSVDGKVYLNHETWDSKDDPKCTKCSCKVRLRML